MKKTRFRSGLFRPVMAVLGPCFLVGSYVLAFELGLEALSWGTIGLLFSGLALSAALAYGLVSWEERRHQRKRDRRAQRKLAALREGKSPKPFSLYLGPSSASRMRGTTIEGMTRPRRTDTFTFPDPSDEADLESSLAEAVEARRPMVALGTPGTGFGAGRAATDDDHRKEDLALLAENAALVLVIPSCQQGMQRELEHVRTHCLPKTVFVMPPEAASTKDFLSWSKQWYALRAECLPELRLPEYDPSGMIFTLDPAGAFLHGERLGGLVDPMVVSGTLLQVEGALLIRRAQSMLGNRATG